MREAEPGPLGTIPDPCVPGRPHPTVGDAGPWEAAGGTPVLGATPTILQGEGYASGRGLQHRGRRLQDCRVGFLESSIALRHCGH